MSNPFEVTAVPRSDSGFLAFVVERREGNWAIGRIPHAGFEMWESEPWFSESRVTWLGDDEHYGLCVPLYTIDEDEIAEAFRLVQGNTPAFLIDAAKDQDRRGVSCRPFRIEHLREMLANYRVPAKEGK